MYVPLPDKCITFFSYVNTNKNVSTTFCRMTYNRKTLTLFTMATLSIMTLNIMTPSIMMLITKTLSITAVIIVTHNLTIKYAFLSGKLCNISFMLSFIIGHSDECHYTQCCGAKTPLNLYRCCNHRNLIYIEWSCQLEHILAARAVTL